VTSRLAVRIDAERRRSRPPLASPPLRRRRQPLRARVTLRGVGEVRTVRSGARGSDRLQKSTSGVWPRAPRGEEPLGSTRGLALSARARGANERRKPADGGKAGRTVAGPSQKIARRKPGFRGALVEERRPGPGMPRGLTISWRKRSFPIGAQASVGRSPPRRGGWGASYLPGFPGQGGARQRASEVGSRGEHTVDNAVAHRRQDVVRRASPSGKRTVRQGRSWEGAVKRPTTRGWASARKPGVVRRATARSRDRTYSPHGPGRASDESSRTRRSTGAREEGRLQTSVRSIFHDACEEDREVVRSTGAVAGSRRHSRDEREPPQIQRKGAEIFSAPNRRPGDFHPTPESRSNPRARRRASSRPKASSGHEVRRV
jgi:hypothetical protein